MENEGPLRVSITQESHLMPLVIDTEKEFDIEDLQYDIEQSRATDRWDDAPPEIKELFHQIEWNVIDGDSRKRPLG